jgi:hypothetical protein
LPGIYRRRPWNHGQSRQAVIDLATVLADQAAGDEEDGLFPA